MSSPLIDAAITAVRTDGVLIATAITVMYFMVAAAKWVRNAEFGTDGTEYQHYGDGLTYGDGLDDGLDDGINLLWTDEQEQQWRQELQDNGMCSDCGAELLQRHNEEEYMHKRCPRCG